MNRAARRAFDQAAGALTAMFEKSGPFPGQEVTPPLLADAVRQCLDVAQRVDDTDDDMSSEEVDELGTHALECLSDLGLWAYQLKLDRERAVIEDLALDMAQWITRHEGRISVLEPVVNAIARQANAMRDPADLVTLFERARDVIAGATPDFDGATDTDAMQPWLTLHFNCAIIATRTQQAGLMNAAYDLLEAHLPQHCATFYEEGVRESEKATYGEHVRRMMRERLAAWTTRH